MDMMKTHRFDAVAESRRWKEAVARQTEGLSRNEVLAFFDKARALAALGMVRHAASPRSSVREDPAQG